MTAAVLQMRGRQSTSVPKPKKQEKSGTSRLPVIAPRYQAWSGPDALDKADLNANASLDLPKTRLPPRSRFGCWTCRTRKVKCDEARPECTPCSRLGHVCDYNPRLSFKDDTPRVIEKLASVTGSGGPVWSPSTPRPFERKSLNNPQIDHLPSFSLLTNDEDREKKAEFRALGTYNVIVNPSSFVESEEYRDTYEERHFARTSPSKASGSVYSDHFSTDQSQYNDDYSPNSEKADNRNDPDIVILKVFEDDAKSVSPGGFSNTQRRLSRTPTLSIQSTVSSTQQGEYFRFSHDNTPLMKMAPRDGRDHQLIYYYKNFVHRHLAQVHRDSLGTSLESGALSAPDVFERQAAEFEPLYHALMAFSALSMSCKNGIPNLDALQHYQQALPLLQANLRSEQDLASDGVFLTHFILLLYEIAAGEPRGLSLWSEHVDQLRRITLLRHEMYGPEPYSFILWWVASIDTHVILSGMGNGDFVERMLRNNMLPSGMDPEYPYQTFEYCPSGGLASPNGHEALPSALSFHRRLSILAAELGLLARDLRAEDEQNAHNTTTEMFRARQEKIGVLQDTLRRAWNVQMPSSVARGYCNQMLPVGARGIFEHSFALYRACLIYSHTSMYATQRLLSSSRQIHEVFQCGGEILRLAREIVSTNHMERKFIVFPLFMAGFVNQSPEERSEILGLVKRMEEDSVGRNLVAARQLLEIVYERQDKRRRDARRERRETGGAGDEEVDWVSIIRELGLQVVNCRL